MLNKKLNILIRYLFITVFICTVTIGKGQNTSSPDNSYQTPDSITYVHSPHKAAIYSAVVPGLGQVYNKKYWKLPIIYGATGIFIYAFDFNNDQYIKYKNAYADMSAGKISSFEGITDEKILLRAKDGYQRDRDLNVIVLAAIYLLNIVDATVDAHLFDYEISDNLSLNIQPIIKKTYDNQNAVSLSCSFSF